jgi:hypothetical protein
LLKVLQDDPKNPRATFYAAQSFRDSGQIEIANVLYEKRVELGGWNQEVYFSLLQLGRSRVLRGELGPATVEILLRAMEVCPERLEAPYYLLYIWRQENKCHLAWSFAKTLLKTIPPKDALFVDLEIHKWRFFEESALCAYFAGDKRGFKKLSRLALSADNIPIEDQKRIKHNLKNFG